MSVGGAAAHPDLPAEQAYIDRIETNRKLQRDRDRNAGAGGGDPKAAAALREQALRRLAQPEDLEKLCFGRMDREDGRRLYIGSKRIHEAGDPAKTLVIGWAVDAAAPFYEAERDDPQGLLLRRRFHLDQLRLLGITDESFAELADGDHIAQLIDPGLEDAILAEMNRGRGAAMRDIVATIEREQYRLIREPIEGLLTIQGGPGTGKTAIALHRAAWLLVNHREDLGRSRVLVVGPNRAFMDYVREVLPSLGEEAVDQLPVDRVSGLEGVRVRGNEAREVARLKGDVRMVRVVEAAVRDRVRPPREDLVLTVTDPRPTNITLPAQELLHAIHEVQTDSASYLAGRDLFRGRLSAIAWEHNPAKESFGGVSQRTLDVAITADGGPLDRIWPTVTAPEAVRDLVSSRQRLATAGTDVLTDDEQALLYRRRLSSLTEEPWTAADIPLLDEAERAVRGIQRTYGYVIADEAQDLSPMQLRMVLRRSHNRRATLVGDIAQATGDLRFDSWDGLLAAAGTSVDRRLRELKVGYRVPRQIADVAAELLPRVAPDLTSPTAVRVGPEAPRLLCVQPDEVVRAVISQVRERVDGDRTIGVIAPLDDVDLLREELAAAGLVVGDVLNDGLGRPITLLSSGQAKGLEFDHVIVVEPARMAGPEREWSYVYVALTRATRTLSVIHTTPEPFPADAARQPEPPEPTVAEAPMQTIDELPTSGGVAPAVGPPVATTAVVELGPRYTEALIQAKFLHSDQLLRVSLAPRLAHLQAVAALVMEDGGSEDEAIAALLHDAAEQHGIEFLDRIAEQFGEQVAAIVAGCTNPLRGSGGGWRESRFEFLQLLESAGPQVRRVALAEALDNARVLLRGYRRLGSQLWSRMGQGEEEVLWYEQELVDLFVTERPGDLAWELENTVARLVDLVTEPEPTDSESTAVEQPGG